MRRRGQLQPAGVVRGVYRAPAPQPGYHQPRDQGQRQLHVEGLGQQLADLGEERQPGTPLAVAALEPAVLHDVRQPLGGQLGERLPVRPVDRGQGQLAAPRLGQPQRDAYPVGGRHAVAVPGDGTRAVAVRLVHEHDRAHRADQRTEPTQQLLPDLGEARLVPQVYLAGQVGERVRGGWGPRFG